MSTYEVTVYNKALSSFTEKMILLFSSQDEWERELWMDLIYTFHPHSIRSWPRGLTYKPCKMLRTKGVHVDNGREKSRAEALVRILFRKIHIQSLPNEKLTDRNEQEAIDPVASDKSASEHQPATETKKGLPKTRTLRTASTKLNTCMDSENEDSSNDSEQGERVDDESFSNSKRLRMMLFRREEKYFSEQPWIYTRKSITG